ncbi:hypothetical protein [Amycolatopsis ruanii]|uniref:hypothetical protein n=1 Tax=Amycolatopsis ruanii TaxID=944491 RepID=UPI001F0870E2|nr:hypothetical protein [Amycolatopsis ruanii]
MARRRPGTLAELRRHTGLDRLAAIWISHLLTAYYGALFADLELVAPIPLFGPPGITGRLADFPTNRDRADTFTATAVEHGMPAFGVRIEAGAASLAYSGDTAPCPAVAAPAKNCDALLCEVGGPVAYAAPGAVFHLP